MAKEPRQTRFIEVLGDTLPGPAQVFSRDWDDLQVLRGLKLNQPRFYKKTDCLGQHIEEPVTNPWRPFKIAKPRLENDVEHSSLSRENGRHKALPPPPLDFTGMKLPVRHYDTGDGRLMPENVQKSKRFPWSKGNLDDGSMHSPTASSFSSPVTGGASVATPSGSSTHQSTRVSPVVPTTPSTESIAPGGLRRGKSLKRKLQGFIPRSKGKRYPEGLSVPAQGAATESTISSAPTGAQLKPPASTSQEYIPSEQRTTTHARVVSDGDIVFKRRPLAARAEAPPFPRKHFEQNTPSRGVHGDLPRGTFRR